MDSQDPLDQVIGYQIFGSRDRFPDPVPSFREALECLQSEEAYLPDLDAAIIAYLEDGRSVPIPDCFFWERSNRFSSKAAAEEWVLKRHEKIKEGESLSKLVGMLLADPGDPIDKQVQDAMEAKVNHVIAQEHNDLICRQAGDWLPAAILAFPPHEVR